MFRYTDKEKEELFKSIIILVDTREKLNQHIIDYFDKKHIQYKKKALKQGDYSFMIPSNSELNIPRDLLFSNKIVVERKASAEELSGNLSQQRDRFEKELALAPLNKVLLIENTSYADIVGGNYNTQYNKKSYLASLHSFWWKYNMPFVFMPNKQYSALFIYGTFQYWLKNYLK